MATLLKTFSTACLCLSLCDCAIPFKHDNGTDYYLIVGVGLVTVNDAAEKAAVVTRAKALGLTISDRPGLKMNVGYASSKVVSVANGAEDVLIEVSDKATGDVSVDVKSASLTKGGKNR